jgi:hypothetical protein
MTVVASSGGVVELSGRCGVEDAEALQRELLAAPAATISWDNCLYLHAAVLQVLLAAKPLVQGVPSSPFLEAHIAPLLQTAAQGDTPPSALKATPEERKDRRRNDELQSTDRR